jgi:putative transposase
LITVILEMKRRNPRFGCPRIAQQVSHAFGIEIDKDVVRRVLAKHYLKSVPFVPRSHPFIERLIGTVRREYLDQVFFCSGLDLLRKLERFAVYYNQRRVHAALGGRTLSQRGGVSVPRRAYLRHFVWRSDCAGPFHTPIAA